MHLLSDSLSFSPSLALLIYLLLELLGLWLQFSEIEIFDKLEALRILSVSLCVNDLCKYLIYVGCSQLVLRGFQDLAERFQSVCWLIIYYEALMLGWRLSIWCLLLQLWLIQLLDKVVLPIFLEILLESMLVRLTLQVYYVILLFNGSSQLKARVSYVYSALRWAVIVPRLMADQLEIRSAATSLIVRVSTTCGSQEVGPLIVT